RVPILLVDPADVAHAARCAGVVDEDVDAAELAFSPAHEGLQVLALCQVGRLCPGLAACRADLVDHLVERPLAAADDDHACAFARQVQRSRAADARATAGDDGDLSVECGHLSAP